MRFSIIAVLAALFLAAPVQAQQPPCAPTDSFRSKLMEKYREAPEAWGLDMNGRIVEVWRSEKGDTWTITLTTPQGTTCLVDAGKDWQSVIWRLPAPASGT